MRVAAIDIGSNSIRLLVGEVLPANGNEDFHLRTVARAGEPCRLARGLGESGVISSDMSERATRVVREFLDRARSLGAVHSVFGATAALRGASNGADVASRIGDAVGVPVRILSGEEEARTVYAAVVTAQGGPARRSPCVVFDIGGGSTEVVSGFGMESGRWTSLPFGAVTLTERYLTHSPPDPEDVRRMDDAVRDEVMHGCANMPERTPMLAGVGGTVTVLALLDRGLTHYDPALIEGWAIERERLGRLVDKIVASPLSELRGWPAMGEGRADIVAAGAWVVRVLADRFPAPAIVCSTQGLRYGLARLAAVEVRKEHHSKENPS
jgi:exopolyphosphatase/guanosine-5'-triphosphate,3'-diphosphate pyrophosphatase